MIRTLYLVVFSAFYALPVWSVNDEKPYVSVHILSENIFSSDRKGEGYISDCNRDNSKPKKPETRLLVHIHRHGKESAYFAYVNIHTVSNSPLAFLIVGDGDDSKGLNSLMDRIYLYKESWVVFHDLSSPYQLGELICGDYNAHFDAVVKELKE